MAESTTDPAGPSAESADGTTPEAGKRPTFIVKTPAGGWAYPWPNVAELARVLPADRWTLIGGLMTQLHAIHHGVNAVRPTNDVDIALHIETARGTPNTTADALGSLGYEIRKSIDPRNNVGHRFTRGDTQVDVVSSDAAEDVVDVVVADHPAPSIEEQMRRMEMVKIPGGTQALRRTANYRLEFAKGEITTISVPAPVRSPDFEGRGLRRRQPRPRQAPARRGCSPRLHRRSVRRARSARRLRPQTPGCPRP